MQLPRAQPCFCTGSEPTVMLAVVIWFDKSRSVRSLGITTNCFVHASAATRGLLRSVQQPNRKRSWPNFKVLFWYSPGGTNDNHKKPVSGYPVSESRFEPGIPHKQSRIVNQSVTTFGKEETRTNFTRHRLSWLGLFCAKSSTQALAVPYLRRLVTGL
jgi:hypothetical protein